MRRAKPGNHLKVNFNVKAEEELFSLKPRANGRNIVGCYMLRLFAHPVACFCVLLRNVAQSLKPVKRLATC